MFKIADIQNDPIIGDSAGLFALWRGLVVPNSVRIGCRPGFGICAACFGGVQFGVALDIGSYWASQSQAPFVSKERETWPRFKR